MWPAPAWAHAYLVATVPANGAVLATSPEQVVLQFSEQVSVGLGEVRLLDASGAVIATQAPVQPPGDPTTIVVGIPGRLASGVHTVAWRALSADTHPVEGAFAFTVGAGGPAAASPAKGAAPQAGRGVTDLVYTLARWSAFAMLALVGGATLFTAWLWPAGVRYRRVRRMLWGGWAALAGSTLLCLLCYAASARGVGLDAALDAGLLWQILQTRAGTALAVRLILLVLLIPVLVALVRHARERKPRVRRLAVAGVLAVDTALAATWSIATHSSVGTDASLAVSMDVVHLVAMSVWIGGLAVLAGALLPARDVAALRTAVPVFSRVAVACVGLLVLTGVYAGWRQVRSVPALGGTTYGHLLLAKLGLVVLLVALGAAARSWVRRNYAADRADPGTHGARKGPDAEQVFRLRRQTVVETVVAIAVLGLSSMLVTTQPAAVALAAARTATAGRPSAPGAAPTPASAPFRAGSVSGSVVLELQPAQVGRAVLHLSVLDDAGDPRDVPQVRVTLSLAEPTVGPMPVDMGAGQLGHYAALATLPLPGRWDVAVTVRTSEVDQTTVHIPVEVQAASG
ncbi:copper resistance CopC/CopD family protein [Catellatospora tritici]|uniref:copper resistance CopC/CopD family protein n=1 Tax=Catellatospora tritici TaxID=2851566 RepID=UPI0020C4218D|nr:copper resistance protein CopC [Catellatospora tritici]